MKSYKFASLIILLLVFSLIFAKHAHAYIDPGSGSYIIQIILATVLGGLFAIKLYWKKIKSYFSNLFSRGRKKEDG